MTPDQQAKTETVKVVSAPAPTSGKWAPIEGEETYGLLKPLRLTEAERTFVREEARRILSHCVPPDAPAGSVTGLCIGYVQSGKTLSFTTVAALARDNNYRVVIVMAGVSKPLQAQSESRLSSDLRLGDRFDRQWSPISNPKPADRARVEAILQDWRDWKPNTPDDRPPTVLITVMKNHRHLFHLRNLILQLQLKEVPVLIIDDEADQAGLNTLVNEGEMSTTYRRILELRAALPHHSYLQYTATPQAPLLINIIDILSPDFVELLTPGEAYVGGKQFFRQGPIHQVVQIGDAPDEEADEPPESLLHALRLFYIGAAAGLCEPQERRAANRSMMIHPSRLVAKQAGYHTWVQGTKSQWYEMLRLPEGSSDRADLVAEFREAYDDLAKTVANIPPFEDVLEKLPKVILRTSVTVLNTPAGMPKVQWNADYAHILIGGQAMDRGYTVAGLTVTYMPRGIGTGTVDTLQQRARFFGYKAGYWGYCRVFLDAEALRAYQEYVRHEEEIRRQLSEFKKTGLPLKEWKRLLLLDARYEPTRKELLDVPIVRETMSAEWFTPRSPHAEPDAVKENREVFASFRSKADSYTTFGEDSGDPRRTEDQRHLVSRNVRIKDVLDELLGKLRMPRQNDSLRLTASILQMTRALDRLGHDARCTVYIMKKGEPRVRGVERHADDEVGTIKNLMQGPHPDAKGGIYPGDRALHEGDQPTLQLHYITIREEESLGVVPTIALWIPVGLTSDVITQTTQ